MKRERDGRSRHDDRQRSRSLKSADRRREETRDERETSRRRYSKSRDRVRDNKHKPTRSDGSNSSGSSNSRDRNDCPRGSRRERSNCRSSSNSGGDGESKRLRQRGRDRSNCRERGRKAKVSSGKRRWGLKSEEATTGDVWNGSRRSEQMTSKEMKEEDEEEEEGDTEPLPVTLFKDEVMKAVRTHQVLVCTGETGSGKTTQIPQYLLELLELDAEIDNDRDIKSDAENAAGSGGARRASTRRLQVAVTQPRRVAATSVAKRVAGERNCRVGEEVGYSIRFEDRTGPNTRIKYCTDGVLVRECLEDPLLSRYGIVMLDEAHERSIDTDVLFGLLKRALAQRPDLHAVITSATLDVERFAEFFGDCPFLQVPGRTHAVDVYHSKTRQVMTANGPASPRYVEDAVDIILKIHRTQGPGHMLAFFTGQDEIERVCRLLSEAMAQQKAGSMANGGVGVDGGIDNGAHERPQELLAVPLFGALSAEAQEEAFRPARHGVRKVVVATNIAETSVTVPGVRYVIDPGYVKQKTYDPARRMESLVIVPISQVAAQQRAGRAGRTAAGQCYRLYSRDCYSAMLRETIPEILRTNLANTLLYLKVLGVDDVLAFDFLDPPAKDQALEALQHLYCLGALDQNGRATDVGRQMSRFPLEPSLSRTLLEAGNIGCLEEVLTIVALLSVESIWFTRSRGGEGSGSGGNGHERGGERDEEADASHALFRHPLGDHFTYLAVYRAWEAGGYSDEWAKGAFLRVRALRTARSVRAQLLWEMRKSNGRGQRGEKTSGNLPDLTSCGRDLDKVRKAFCAGYFMYAGQRCSKEWVYRSLAVEALQREGTGTGQSGLTLMYLHPTSVLVHAPEPPEHVMYTELVYTARPFMRHAMSVKGHWLRSRLESVQPVSSDKLCGHAMEPDSEVQKSGSDSGPGGARAEGEEGRMHGLQGQRAKKIDAVAAARARFLARKQTR